MTTVFDVPAELLINTVADEFKDNNDKIVAPEWTKLVKTGVHKERKPENIDWWYVRCAKKDRGVNPEKFRKGSGSIVRVALHQLEDAGYVEKVDAGRIITPEGRSFLDNTSAELIKDIPELSKY